MDEEDAAIRASGVVEAVSDGCGGGSTRTSAHTNQEEGVLSAMDLVAAAHMTRFPEGWW